MTYLLSNPQSHTCTLCHLVSGAVKNRCNLVGRVVVVIFMLWLWAVLVVASSG